MNAAEQSSRMSNVRRGGLIAGLCAVALVFVACGGGGGSGDRDTGTAGPPDSGDTGVDTISPDTSRDTTDGGGDADVGDDADAGGCGPLEERDTSIDRDRDGLPDECDNFKFLNHGGDNPTDALVVPEREDEIGNDSTQAGENYDIEFPFIFEGESGPIEDGDPDLDYVSFRVDEPTALLIRVESVSEKLWPGSIIFGYDTTNNNVQYLQLGNGPDSAESVREVFLPVPGRYTIAFADARNILTGQNNVGGQGEYEYRASVSKVPLPKIESAEVPGSKSHDYKQRLHAYEIDASSLDGLELNATGTAREQNALHNPAVTVFDPDEKRSLSYTVGSQVDTDTRSVELETKLNNVEGRLLVVEDQTGQIRKTESKVEFSETTVDSEFETLQNPQDERASNLVWLQPGDTVSGTIGAPRMSGQASLAPDEDYYLVSARRGMAVEITVEPKSGSQLQPAVEYGSYRALSDGSFFSDRFGHTVSEATNAGESRTVRFLHTNEREAEYAIQVLHAPNESADNPDGGSNFGYDISVETWEVNPATMASAPGSADVSVDTGGVGVVEFTPNSDGLYRFVPSIPDGVSFSLQGRAIEKSSWEQIRSGEDGLAFKGTSGATYWYDFRDSFGEGTDGENVTVEVQELNPEELTNLPATKSSRLDDSNPSDYYKFSASEGEQLDLRLSPSDTSVLPRMRVLDPDTLNAIASGRTQVVFEAPSDGEYLVRIELRFGSGTDYDFGLQQIDPTALSSVPSTESGTLDNQPFPKWYKFSVEKDSIYQATLEQTGSGNFNEELGVYSAEDLEQLRTGDTTARFRAPSDGEVLVVAYDNDQQGSSDYDFDLAVEQLREESLTVGQMVNGQLNSGSEGVLYTFNSGGAGSLEFDVSANGAWTPQVRLLGVDEFEESGDITSYRGILRFAAGSSGDYGLLVRASDPSRSGPLGFTIESNLRSTSTTTADQEPNNDAAEAQKLTTYPAVIGGSIDSSGDTTDYFEVELQAGQRVWALPIPQDDGERNSVFVDLDLLDPDDNTQAFDSNGGYGSFPALFAEPAPSSGTWGVSLNDASFGSSDYFLYVYRSEVKSLMEKEPNNVQGTAQELGPVDVPVKIASSVDGSNKTDLFEFELTRDVDSLRVFLENAASGYNLRLLDSSFSQIAASGPDYGGASDPSIDNGPLTAGTYFVELGQGNAGGSVDVIVVPEP